MAEGTYGRGEVWWLRDAESIGSEEALLRPCTIISGSKANETNSTVLVALMSTQSNALSIYPKVFINGKTQRVLCNHIRSVDKSRLGRYIGKLTEPEMICVTGALAIAMCIPTNSAAPKVDDSDELIALRAECDMFKKLYEKAMDTLVDMRFEQALHTKKSAPQPEPEVAGEEEPQPEPEKPDVNTCSVEDLMNCGCTLPLARLIISYRPYKMIGDLKRVPGLKSTAFQILKNRLWCIPTAEKPKMVEETELVDINTASFNALRAVGVSENITATIINNRPYNSVDDLKNVPGIGERTFEFIKKKLCCTPIEEPKQELVNINTATAQELEKLGMRIQYARYVTGHRKKIGKFTSWDQFSEIKYLPKSFLSLYKERLTLG